MVMYDATDNSVTSILEFDSTLPAVLIDKVQIQQILINLIRNSIEAMHDSVERILTLITVPGESGFVNVLVRDTGPGLAPGVLQRLFQPFNTTKKSGMGLGLMVCQTLAEANGGRIWRLDDQAKGTCFCLSLPLVQSETNKALPAAA
jgi:two-component system sensor kinase FixL